MMQPSPTSRDHIQDETVRTINTHDVDLAQCAANGDATARREINNVAHPMIRYQTEQFCPRFCHDNRLRYQCTLPSRNITPGHGSPLCEWGNASYGWMLNDLTKPERLSRFQGHDGAKISAYFSKLPIPSPFMNAGKIGAWDGAPMCPPIFKTWTQMRPRFFMACVRVITPC